MHRLFTTACLAFILFSSEAIATEIGPDQGVTVHVHKNGDLVVIDVSFTVSATQRETWNVLCDFEHMSEFVSNLQSSKVILRAGNKMQVAQVGKASHGVTAFAFESVREIELSPFHAIRSRLISGNMKKLDGLTLLKEEGSETRVVYHGESIPNIWVPPVVGITFIENEVREQFREIRAEIMKRKASAAKPL